MRTTKVSPTLLATAIIIASMAMWRESSAKTVSTPFGHADDSCVHEIPNGGVIDVQTGDVTVNKNVVTHLDSCTTSPFPLQTPSRNGGAPTTVDWYEWSWATATNIDGLAQFDNLTTSWFVPENPSVPSNDTSVQYYFSSLQNGGGGCASNKAIIQPVLQWGNDGHFGGENWEIASWAVWGCNSSCNNCSIAFSPPENVSQFDTINGYLFRKQFGNPDQWGIKITDDNGAYSSISLENIPNSWPKFNTAQSGVLEAYGNATQTIPLNSCSELPPNEAVTFSVTTILEGGPYWYSQNDAPLTWTTGTGSESPHCSWDPFLENGSSAGNVDLFWTP